MDDDNLSDDLKRAISSHIKKLEWIEKESEDEERRIDAKHSLAIMAILSGEPPAYWERILTQQRILTH